MGWVYPLLLGWLGVALITGALTGLMTTLHPRSASRGYDLFILLGILPFVVGGWIGIGVARSYRLVATAIDEALDVMAVFAPQIIGAGAALILIGAAQAGDGSVVIPWGDWTAGVLRSLEAVIVAVAAVALRSLPAAVLEWYQRLTGERVDQLLDRAIGWGINAVAGAVRGRVLEIDIGMSVAREALDYCVRHAPALVERIGESGVMEKILARLPLDQAAAVTPQGTAS